MMLSIQLHHHNLGLEYSLSAIKHIVMTRPAYFIPFLDKIARLAQTIIAFQRTVLPKLMLKSDGRSANHHIDSVIKKLQPAALTRVLNC